MHELQAHYDVMSEGTHHKQVAWVVIKNILYKNDNTFTF